MNIRTVVLVYFQIKLKKKQKTTQLIITRLRTKINLPLSLEYICIFVKFVNFFNIPVNRTKKAMRVRIK